MRIHTLLVAASILGACSGETSESIQAGTTAVASATAVSAAPVLDDIPEDALPPGFDESKGFAEYALRDGRHVMIISPGIAVPEQNASLEEGLGTNTEALTASAVANPDTWVRRTSAGAVDFGKSCELRVNNILNGGQEIDMAMLRFAIPTVVQCATIQSATLIMKTGQAPSTGAQLVVFAHRISQNWVAGPTGAVGGCSSCGLLTGAANPFASPAFGAAISPVPVNTPCKVHQWDLTPMVSGVNGWCAAPQNNFGVMLGGRNGAITVNFHSNEAPTAADRPKLVIVY